MMQRQRCGGQLGHQVLGAATVEGGTDAPPDYTSQVRYKRTLRAVRVCDAGGQLDFCLQSAVNKIQVRQETRCNMLLPRS